MPTYNEVVDGHSPLVLMQSNGSTIVDQSSNALPLVAGALSYAADLHGFRKTDANYGWRSNEFSGTSIPYFEATASSNLMTLTMWIYRPTSTSRVTTSYGQSQLTQWTTAGIFGINTFNGNVHGFSESLLLDNKWHHVAFTFDSTDVQGTVRGWLDGVEQTISHSGTPVSRNISGSLHRVFITGDQVSGGTFADQDDVSTVHSIAWFDSNLTETQIQEQANHNFGSEINALTGLVMGKKPTVYYKFWDDDPINTVVDQLGVNHLTLSGSHTRNSTGLPGEPNGNSITMQPGGYGVSAVDSTFWNILGLSQWSFEAWIEAKALPASASAFFGIGQSGGVYTSLMSRDDMQSLRWEVWNAASFYSEIYKHDLNQLYHVVYTMDTDGRRMYVNGQLIGFTTDLTAPGAVTDRFWLNRNPWESQSRHDFDCHEIAVYFDHVLTPAEVLQHYASGSGSNLPDQAYMDSVNALSPIAYYPCNAEAVATDKLFDVSGNSHTMTLPAGAGMDNSGLNGTRAYNHNLANVSPVLMPTNGLTTFTLEFWLKVDARPVAQYDVFAGLYNGSTRFDYHSDSNVNVGTRVYNNLNSGDFGSNSNMGDLHRVGKWYHIALTCDTAAGEILTYVDSSLANITPVNAGAIPDLNLILGNLSTNAYPADCSLQHIALYNVVLSPTQIKNHYRIKRPLPVESGVYEKSVVADEPITYLKMNETAGSTLVDTMRGLDGLLNTTPADTLNGLGQNRYHSSDTAIHFDSAAWVDLGDLAWFGYDKKNRGFTMEMLLEFTELAATNTIIGFAETSGFRFDKEGALLRWRHVQSGTSTFSNQYSTRSVETGKLYHCVVTFDGQFVIVYMNGEQWINADLGANYDGNLNTYNKFIVGAQWNIGDVTDARSDEIVSHFAYYDYVVPKANWMNRTRLVHGDISDNTSTPYQDVVEFDQPLVYCPLNDSAANYPLQISEIGNADSDTRIPYQLNSSNNLLFNQPSIVVGGGLCMGANTIANGAESIQFNEDIAHLLTGDLSCEVWFNLDTLGTRLFAHGSPGETLSSNYLIWIDVETDGSLEIGWEYGAGTNELSIHLPPGTFTTGTTYHLVMTRNSATKEVYTYVNNVKSSVWSYTNDPVVTSPAAANRLRFFGDANGGAIPSQMHGRQSHIAVYDKVLTDQQVDDHYNAGIGNPVGAIRQVNGTVTEEGVPVARKVFIYDRADGSYITETTSSAVDGTFSVQWRNPDPLKRYMVIVQDDDLSTEYEPVVRDRIEAVDV